MKKLGINTAAAIMDIIGASIYLIALLTALITYDMDKNIVFDIFFLILRGFAIGGGIVVQLRRVAGGRADLWIDAPREVPVVRGTVLERNGGERPACLEPPSGRKPKGYRDRIFR